MNIESDLRPIFLTPTKNKILESFVGEWILQKIENCIDKKQLVAMRRRSTTHELVDILHHWHAALDSNNYIRAVILDYAKAFEDVDHGVIIAELQALDQPPVLMPWKNPCYNRPQLWRNNRSYIIEYARSFVTCKTNSSLDSSSCS